VVSAKDEVNAISTKASTPKFFNIRRRTDWQPMRWGAPSGTITHFFLLAYARAKRAVTPVNKGLSVSFLCSFFVSLLKLKYREI
ncbi:MAG: hypothetical protein ACFNS5_08285, partial [Prevotella melaninogenica]